MTTPTIPSGVRFSLEYHIHCIERANEAIQQTRKTEAMFGSPGRYEWEYRTTNYPDLQPSLLFFEEFERRARDNGIDPQAIYQEYGGKPCPLPWSEEAESWL